MYNGIRLLMLGVSAPAIASFLALGCAQETPLPADMVTSDTLESSALEDDDNRLDVVVITANKREQNLNEVGLAVSVLSGDEFQQRQINSLSDIANSVPGLSFTNSTNGTPVLTLRGIGFNETSLGAYPTVSSYVDEVPLPFPVLSSHTAFDLERVEVLKGPQGTLFGQNATGGAINYIAAKPTDTFQAGGFASYGRFNEVIAEGFLSGPFSPNLKARLSGRIVNADGWQESNSRPGDKNGTTKNVMARLLLDFEPSDTIRFNVNLNGWTDKSDTIAPQYIAIQPQQPFLDPLIANASFSPEEAEAADWTPGVPRRDNTFYQASVRSELDLTDDITLTSLTSYLEFEQSQGDDGDGLPATSLDLLNNDGEIESFNQELRISNGGASSFRYVVGANYEKSSVDQVIDLDFDNSAASETFGIALGFPFFSATYSNFQDYETYAVFANGEFDVSENLTLRLGGRYTDSQIDAQICSRDLSGVPTNTGPLFFDVLLGGAFGPYDGQCYVINNQPETINGVAPGAPGEFADQLSEDNFSWRAGIDWKPSSEVLVYVNVAEGFKAGSFPVLSASLFNQYLPVTQESVLSYEAGFKASLFDRVLQLNTAIFYYDYKDKQLRSKLVDANFGILDVLQNIPESEVSGLEIEAVLRPVEGLTINSALTYLDASIGEFSGVNAGGLAADFAGASVPFTPEYQFGINADYEFPINERLDGFIGSSVNYRSDTVSTIGGETNPPTASPQDKTIFEIDEYTLVDLRAGIQSSDGRWRASIWAKNVFDEYHWSNVVAATDTIGRYASRPATYGISASVRY